MLIVMIFVYLLGLGLGGSGVKDWMGGLNTIIVMSRNFSLTKSFDFFLTNNKSQVFFFLL